MRSLSRGLFVAWVLVSAVSAAAPRLRGGVTAFGLGGLVTGTLSSAPPTVAGVSMSGRIGVQINDRFGLLYQQMPVLGGVHADGGLVGVMDFNALMVSVTFLNRLEVAVGPSIDWARLAGLQSAQDVQQLWGAGLHCRVAFALPEAPFGGSRREGFTFSLDFHPSLLVAGVDPAELAGLPTTLLAGFGIGYEWF